MLVCFHAQAVRARGCSQYSLRAETNLGRRRVCSCLPPTCNLSLMDPDVEIPDVRFWGLVVHAGKSATYSIDNEHGLLELCHLTNIALVSDSSHERPIYVRIRSPDDENEYTLGALIPGKLYSFSTDLMIAPDTQFTHTGTARDQVHLTGYRCGCSIRACSAAWCSPREKRATSLCALCRSTIGSGLRKASTKLCTLSAW